MVAVGGGVAKYFVPKNSKRVLIANYGEHTTLNSFISGVEEYFDNSEVLVQVNNADFKTNLIAPMFESVRWFNRPDVIITMSTPVSQFAVNYIDDIPIIASVVDDPVSARILSDREQSRDNITVVSDGQNIPLLLDVITKLLPKANCIGVPYSIYEINDVVMVEQLADAAKNYGVEIVKLGIDKVNNIATTLLSHSAQLDCIYVGTSGVISPSLSIITSISNDLKIPVIAVNDQAVKEGKILASVGVNYKKLGAHAGAMVRQILNGVEMQNVLPYYPQSQDYEIYVSNKHAQSLGLKTRILHDSELGTPITYID